MLTDKSIEDLVDGGLFYLVDLIDDDRKVIYAEIGLRQLIWDVQYYTMKEMISSLYKDKKINEETALMYLRKMRDIERSKWEYLKKIKKD